MHEAVENEQVPQRGLENRYSVKLRDHNQAIIELAPANQFLRTILGLEFKRIYKPGNRVLEIGCGEGDSALPLLQRSEAEVDLLDESPEMIEIAKRNLSAYAQRTRYIQKDASLYLDDTDPYDIITTSWTFHNFPKADRERLFKKIYTKLNSGGTFLFMDKVYASGDKKAALQTYIDRYQKYLPPDVAKEIVDHEIMDATDTYRFDEEELIPLLTSIGFKCEIIERSERDIVLVAKK